VVLPLAMGHEIVGRVAKLGPDAKGVKVGDRRLVHPWLGCGECAICRTGEEQMCRTPFSIGVFRSGGYADHLLVPHPRYLFDIGNIPPERAAPLACSGITTYGALKKVGPMLQQEPMVIIGAGGLGLMCLALHKAMGGKAAIVVDIDPVKREAAKKRGAHMTIDPSAPDASKQILNATEGGTWAVIDLVGASRTAQLGLDSLRKGGKLIIVGLFGGDITVPTPSFPLRAITIQGSYVGSLTEMAELLDLVQRKGVPDLPVGTRPLAAVNDALEELKSGKVVGRLVLTPAA
jgi:D-arabinose 1-dehydrogenase-like Zn-dependent alcohol dehydrogenase